MQRIPKYLKPLKGRPPRTRLFVPGFNSDHDQFRIDQASLAEVRMVNLATGGGPYTTQEYRKVGSPQLGIAPAIALAVAGKVKKMLKKPADKVASEKVGALSTAVKQGSIAALSELLRGAQTSATVKSRAVFLKALESLAAAGTLTPGPAWRGHDAEIWAGTIIKPGQFQFKGGLVPAVAITPPTISPMYTPGVTAAPVTAAALPGGESPVPPGTDTTPTASFDTNTGPAEASLIPTGLDSAGLKKMAPFILVGALLLLSQKK